MAGADVVQIVSALMKRGPADLARIRDGFERWADEHEYELGAGDARHACASPAAANPQAFERGNYRHMLRAARPRDISRAGH